MVLKRKKIKTLFVSDLHIGLYFSKLEYFYKILDYYEMEAIYFIGDTMNSTKLAQRKKELFDSLLNNIDKNTKLYFLQGNHDKELHYNEKFINEMVYTTLKNKKYLLIHGDIYEQTVPPLSLYNKILGESVYFVALHLNDIIYAIQKKLNHKKTFLVTKFIKEHHSLIIQSMKKCKLFLSDYAKQKELNGVICGHIHYPMHECVNGVDYFNCGDWIENLSFVIEEYNGELKLLTFHDIYDMNGNLCSNIS